MPTHLQEIYHWPTRYNQLIEEMSKEELIKFLREFFKDWIYAQEEMARDLQIKLNIPVIEKAHEHGDNADATLSGTAKVFEVLDEDGTTYYFKGYPTKT